MLIRIALTLGLLSLAASTTAWADPFALSYSGRLTQPDGKPVEGPVHVEIRFFRAATGGAPVPVSLLVHDEVKLKDGVFSLAIDLSEAEYQLVFDGSSEAWIEVTVDGATRPRQRFSAVPFARKVPVDGETIRFDDDGRLTIGSLPVATGADSGLIKATPGFL